MLGTLPVTPPRFHNVMSFFDVDALCLTECGVSGTQVKRLEVTAATSLDRMFEKTGMEEVRWCVGLIATARVRTGVCCAEEDCLGVEGGSGTRKKSGLGRSVGFLMLEKDTERR